MIFNSIIYMLFLAGVFGLYWLARRVWLQNILLLAASYIFYAAWDWRFVALLWFSTLVNHVAGLWMGRSLPQARRKLLLIGTVAVNLGLLGFFKYFNFFVDSAANLLRAVGVQANTPSLQIILPIGISFFTFQALSYVFDVYNGKQKPVHSLLTYALYQAFFPQLTAGPIGRASQLLPQFEKPRNLEPGRIESGLVLILLGMFKKIVIADVAASLIEPGYFASPLEHAPGLVLISVYLFALQIYGDFSGYSDIARGSARLLGIELMENFNQPYFSQTVSEFWPRWHISLSSWLRDYLFFPLSRALLKRRWPSMSAYIGATMVTMLLAGLWHGANYTYVLWGGLLGVYLVIARLLMGKALRWRKHPRAWVRAAVAGGSILLTFHMVLVTWVLFRAPDMASASQVYQQMWAALAGGFDLNALGRMPFLLYGVMFLIDWAQVRASDHAFTLPLPVPVSSAIYVAALVLIVVFLVKPYVPFFYFQF